MLDSITPSMKYAFVVTVLLASVTIAAGRQPQLRRIDVAVVAGDDRCGTKERLSVGVYDTLQVVRLYLEAAIGKDCESGGELGRRFQRGGVGHADPLGDGGEARPVAQEAEGGLHPDRSHEAHR